MHAYIVSGGNQSDRFQKIETLLSEFGVSTHDTIYVQKTELSIGIDDIRAWSSRILLKPLVGNVSCGIITDAQSLTTQAQQALLKTLEEPPGHCKIILESQTSDVLLPTILSRCHVITVKSHDASDNGHLETIWNTIGILASGTTGEKMMAISSIGTSNDDFRTWVSNAIRALDIYIRQGKKLTPALARAAHILLDAQTKNNTNIQIQLVLESAFL